MMSNVQKFTRPLGLSICLATSRPAAIPQIPQIRIPVQIPQCVYNHWTGRGTGLLDSYFFFLLPAVA